MGLPRNAIVESQNNEIRQLRQLMANNSPLNAELNLICHPLALLVAHHIFHVSGLRVNVRTSISPIELQTIIVSRSILCSYILKTEYLK